MYSQKLIIDDVIPWGKTLQEHQQFFNLPDIDDNKTIACFGDGTSSINAELTEKGKKIFSFDPIYQFDVAELEKRFFDVLKLYQTQMSHVATDQRSLIEEVMSYREKATQDFLRDYELGKQQKRYITHHLPDKIPFKDNYFDLSLSSHFLLLYDHMGIDFHLRVVSEIMRVSRELRIFPVINLTGSRSSVLNHLLMFLSEKKFIVDLAPIEYKFNNLGSEVLIIKKPA